VRYDIGIEAIVLLHYQLILIDRATYLGGKPGLILPFAGEQLPQLIQRIIERLRWRKFVSFFLYMLLQAS
jgi:hypothetical protein